MFYIVMCKADIVYLTFHEKVHTYRSEYSLTIFCHCVFINYTVQDEQFHDSPKDLCIRIRYQWLQIHIFTCL